MVSAIDVFLDSSILIEHRKGNKTALLDAMLNDRYHLYYNQTVLSEYLFVILAHASLLLLKHGYCWIQYVSLEHETESRKRKYYRVLRNRQVQCPEENVSEWVLFFFRALRKVQQQLM